MVAAGIMGVWLAGLMNPQPIAMTRSTMVTFVTTMSPFTNADSCVPRMSSSDSAMRMAMAGMFTIPWTPSIISNGECRQAYGTLNPTYPRTRLKYSLQAMATVAAPTAYSSTRSQPMIHATSSPIVA